MFFLLIWTVNSTFISVLFLEGVKPMERYAVSVTALYGEQGAGQDGTIHMYTRQGGR